jgi:hypothetical protein
MATNIFEESIAPEEGGHTFPQNAGNHLWDHTVSQSRSTRSTFSLPLKPQISNTLILSRPYARAHTRTHARARARTHTHIHTYICFNPYPVLPPHPGVVTENWFHSWDHLPFYKWHCVNGPIFYLTLPVLWLYLEFQHWNSKLLLKKQNKIAIKMEKLAYSIAQQLGWTIFYIILDSAYILRTKLSYTSLVHTLEFATWRIKTACPSAKLWSCISRWDRITISTRKKLLY